MFPYILIIIICLLARSFAKEIVKPKRKSKHKIKSDSDSRSNFQQESNATLSQDEIDKLLAPSIDPIMSKYGTVEEFRGCYQKTYLLSKNEYYEFKKLREICDRKELIICPKVRLLDLVRPINGVEKYKTLFYKVQSKHVDFVLCDKNLYVQAILEIDDGSHKEPGRKERDEFVDFVLKDVGYKVIRVASVTPEALSNI